MTRLVHDCLNRCFASLENSENAGGADAEKVCECVHRDYIETNVDEHQPRIPPMMGIEDVEPRAKQLIGGSGGAKFASRRGVCVGQIAASERDVRREEISALFPGWRVYS